MANVTVVSKPKLNFVQSARCLHVAKFMEILVWGVPGPVGLGGGPKRLGSGLAAFNPGFGGVRPGCLGPVGKPGTLSRTCMEGSSGKGPLALSFGPKSVSLTTGSERVIWYAPRLMSVDW